MAIPITVPRLGWNMEQGVFVGWLKADGEPIRAGEALFTLEGEKATEDVEGVNAAIEAFIELHDAWLAQIARSTASSAP